MISFTTYTPRSDWWTHNVIFYEYGVSTYVQVTILESTPFKPNIYETEQERSYFILDAVRIALGIGVTILFMLFKIITHCR